MSSIHVNETIRLKVTFYEWDDSQEPEDIEDPVSVVYSIYDDAATPGLILTGTPLRESAGVYYYDWTPDTAGSYTFNFTATFADDSVDVVTSHLTVLATGASVQGALYADEIIPFAGVFDPMLIDPEELSSVFPDAPASEIAEQIYFASLEVVAITGIDLDSTSATYLMLDYVKAAAACALSRTFDYATGDEQSVRLGDLDVVNRVFPKNSANRSNATTWCELAAALRKELIYENTGARAVVHGGSYDSPIPNRDLRNFSRGDGYSYLSPVRQGHLDDVPSDDARRVF